MIAPAFIAWRHRFVFALVLVSVTMLVGIVGGYWYINAKWANANGVKLHLDAAGPAQNYLILGSDTRSFVDNPKDAASFGETQAGCNCADTIIVLRVEPGKRKALLVSFPRDLWVDVPGRGSSKINASFAKGPQGVIDTIRANFRVPINHYIEVDFATFRKVVDAIGGVQMYVPAPARDHWTGLDIPEAGNVTFDGTQALAWVRSRHYQYFESGRWRSDPTADFGRIKRQQDFIRQLLAQSMHTAASNPLKVNGIIDTALSDLTVDSKLGISDILKLVRVFRSGNPDDVEMLTVPADVGRRGSQSVVIARPEAEQIFERLRGEGGSGTVTPQNVTVRVLNGVGTSGLATRTARALQQAGFQPGGVGDASHFGYQHTEVRYRPGAKAKADLVRRRLGGVGRLVQDSSINEVDVVLVVGSDYQGVATSTSTSSRG